MGLRHTRKVGPSRSSLAADERGATAIEYALLAAMVGIVAISALQAFGTETGVLYGMLDAINQAIGAALGA